MKRHAVLIAAVLLGWFLPSQSSAQPAATKINQAKANRSSDRGRTPTAIDSGNPFTMGFAGFPKTLTAYNVEVAKLREDKTLTTASLTSKLGRARSRVLGTMYGNTIHWHILLDDVKRDSQGDIELTGKEFFEKSIKSELTKQSLPLPERDWHPLKKGDLVRIVGVIQRGMKSREVVFPIYLTPENERPFQLDVKVLAVQVIPSDRIPLLEAAEKSFADELAIAAKSP